MTIMPMSGCKPQLYTHESLTLMVVVRALEKNNMCMHICGGRHSAHCYPTVVVYDTLLLSLTNHQVIKSKALPIY